VKELTEPVTLMGPVAISVSEPLPWPLLFWLGELGSYAWPFSMLIAFAVSRPRRRLPPGLELVPSGAVRPPPRRRRNIVCAVTSVSIEPRPPVVRGDS
jgi:hypothetical protein